MENEALNRILRQMTESQEETERKVRLLYDTDSITPMPKIRAYLISDDQSEKGYYDVYESPQQDVKKGTSIS